MAILKNSLPVGFSFALCTSILLLLTFSSTPVSALELKVPSIANLRSAFGGDSLLTTSAIPNRSGPSFTYGKLVFRPYDFILEGYLFGLCFLYLLVSYAGKLRNRSLVNNWFNHAEKFLLTEFSAIADGKVGGGGGNKTLWNGGGEAVVYAGGRRNVEGLQALFTLVPYHDPMELFYNFIQDIVQASISSRSQDVLTLNFNLPTSASPLGIFAITTKSSLRTFRKSRFDLTFAKVNDSDDVNSARGLGKEWCIMSEVSETTDQLLGEVGPRGEEKRQRIGIQRLLNEDGGKILRSLCFTDVWEGKPEEAAILPPSPSPRLVLTLNLPKSASEIQQSLNLISLALNITDGLGREYIKLRADTMTKLAKNRVEVKKELQDRWDRWDREEAEEARQKAKAEADAAKLAKLSPAEQEKRKKVEQKRAMKKAQGKQQKVR